MWQLLEPLHAVVYFPPKPREYFESIGLKGFWMGYFASRSAALGPVGPEVVEALFYVFHPAMVARALPDAWDLASPGTVLAARAALADGLLRVALGELAEGEKVDRAAELATAVAQDAPVAGRPLGAAHAAVPLPPPGNPLGRLWWAASVLREHRFDGHVAALMMGGVRPCEVLVLAAAAGAVGPDGAAILQASRKWSDEEWAEATGSLRTRGWLDEAAALTDAGRAAHEEIEAATDRAAATAYMSVPDTDLDALAKALQPLAERVAATGALPYPNPIGLAPRQ